MSTDVEISEKEARYRQELAVKHSAEYPDGCPDWCDACAERLGCRNGRHEWPRDYADGDSCYCGHLYLFANAVDERPHVRTR